MGSTHKVDKVYKEYIRHMKLVSADVWEPHPETLQNQESAYLRTSAYRPKAQGHPQDHLRTPWKPPSGPNIV